MVLRGRSLEVTVRNIRISWYKQTELEIIVSILLYMFNRMFSSQIQTFHRDNQISSKHSFLIKSTNSTKPINNWLKNSSQESLTFNPLQHLSKLKTQILKMRCKKGESFLINKGFLTDFCKNDNFEDKSKQKYLYYSFSNLQV